MYVKRVRLELEENKQTEQNLKNYKNVFYMHYNFINQTQELLKL